MQKQNEHGAYLTDCVRNLPILDDALQKRPNLPHKVSNSEVVFMCRLGPWFVLLEKRQLVGACRRMIDALLAFRIVWLACAEVSMREYLLASLDYLKPVVAGPRPRRQSICFCEHA